MISAIVCFLLSLALSLGSEIAVIAFFRKRRIGQPILSYVSEHSGKSGTPTMGGIGFVLSSVAAYLIVYGFKSVYAVFACALFVIFAAIGFADDFIKLKFAHNEGLKPWQKTLFLTVASIIAAAFLVMRNQTVVYIPFTRIRADLGVWFFPLAVFALIATTNCVNLTDGLDGLAASVSTTYLVFAALLVLLQINNFSDYYGKTEEMRAVACLAVSVVASLAGFLFFNVNKAYVFMGDTGSLALGAMCAFVMLSSGNALYIPVIGITFVLSGVSVILQVAHFKRTGRRIFLMAPLHHHFQHKGYSETRISFGYVLATIVMGIAGVVAYVQGV